MRKVIPVDAVLIPDQAECVFKGVIFDVYQWQQVLFDGSHKIFEMLKRADTVSAMCIVDGKMLLLEEEQPHAGSRINFPGGRVDDTDDSPLEAIKREVCEETGYTFKSWKLIKAIQPYSKMEFFVYVFLAIDPAGTTEPALDAGEKITITFKDYEEIVDLSGRKMLYEPDDIFIENPTLDDILALPVFAGQEVDR